MHILLDKKLSEAREGNTEAARWAINEFRATIRNFRDKNGNPHCTASGCGTQFDEKLLDYLAECIDKLSEGKLVRNGRPIKITADEAFNLAQPGKRGRKQSANTRKDSLLRGLEAWKEYKKTTGNKDFPNADGRTMSNDIKTAIDVVADTEKLSTETVRRDYKLWRSLVLSLDAG